MTTRPARWSIAVKHTSVTTSYEQDKALLLKHKSDRHSASTDIKHTSVTISYEQDRALKAHV